MESSNQSAISNFNQSVMLDYNQSVLLKLSFKKELSRHDIDRVEIMISENPELLSTLDATSCARLKDKFVSFGLLTNNPVVEKIDQASSLIKTNFLDPFLEIQHASSVLEKLSLLDDSYRLVIYRTRKTGFDNFCLEKPRSKFEYAKSFATVSTYSIHELPKDVVKILEPLLLKTNCQLDLLMSNLLNENTSKEKLKKGLALITAFRDTCFQAKKNLVDIGLYPEILDFLDTSIENYAANAAKLISKSFNQFEGTDICNDIKVNFVNDFYRDYGKNAHSSCNYELPGLVATDFHRTAILELNGKTLYKNGVDDPNLSYETLAKAFGEAPDAAHVTKAVCLLLTQGVGFGSLGKKGAEHFLNSHQYQAMDHRLFDISIDQNRLITIQIKTLCYSRDMSTNVKNYSNPVAICAKIQVPAGELKNAVLTKNADFLKNLKVNDSISVPIIRKAQERSALTLGIPFDNSEAMNILKNIQL